jgi:uncharacterized membrane protein
MLDSLTSPILSFLAGFPPPIAAFLLGGAPISEVRGAAIYAFGVGNPGLMLFGILGNLFAVFCLLVFWDLLRIDRIGTMIVGKRLESMIEKFHKNHELGETIALALFIGVPLPLVGGAYSGILVGKILKMPNGKIIIASVAGILLTSLIMYLALSGAVSVLSIFK